MSVQNNVTTVLNRLAQMTEYDEDFAEQFAEDLEVLLDEIASQDGFGTERQSDPRGDFREGEWSLLDKIQ